MSTPSKQLRIALVGRAGSGKDYTVEVLDRMGLRVKRFAYADNLKFDAGFALADTLFDRVCQGTPQEVVDWVNARKHLPAMRALLQAYGEAAKVVSGDEEFWADRCRDGVGIYLGYASYLDAPEIDAIVITDCRTLQEAEHARRDGFSIVRVLRTDGYVRAGMTAEASAHRSETEQDRIADDATLYNDGTGVFDWQIKKLVMNLRGQ